MRNLLAVILLAIAVPLSAAQPPSSRHTIRLGWGDPLFETLAFRATTPGTYPSPGALPAGFTREENYGYCYTGHFFAEYLYRFTKVVSVGFQADLEGIFWKEGKFDRNHMQLGQARQVNNWDLVFMPTVRFTYFDRPWVRIYSGLGAGDILAMDNQGTAKMGFAVNLNWVGVEVGKGHWGGTFELGMLNALSDAYHIYQAGSRLFSASVYYKW